MNTGRIRASVLLVLVLVAAGGCAGGGGSPASTSAPTQSATASMPMGSSAPMSTASGGGSAAGLAITIKDFAYGDPLTVAAGATVTVTNMDTAAHTVTADQGAAFDVKIEGSGGTATFTAPSQPGAYPYHCTYHPGMHGTLTVR